MSKGKGTDDKLGYIVNDKVQGRNPAPSSTVLGTNQYIFVKSVRNELKDHCTK